jgi:hypothetical protein
VQPSIPAANAVQSAFKKTAKRLKSVQKKVNVAAARDMKAGKYETAQKWIEIGRAVKDFGDRARAFAEEWKHLVKATRIVARSNKTSTSVNLAQRSGPKRTPAWKFCAPALQELIQKGGTASLDEIRAGLEVRLGESLTEPDLEMSKSRGIPRWHVAVQRAYRQCQKEGWIEKQKLRDGIWRMTPKGKAVADGSIRASEAVKVGESREVI